MNMGTEYGGMKIMDRRALVENEANNITKGMHNALMPSVLQHASARTGVAGSVC
jgi:hypothetical protein